MVFTIYPWIGVNEIRFGMTPDQVHSILGTLPSNVFTGANGWIDEQYDGWDIGYMGAEGCCQIGVSDYGPEPAILLNGLLLSDSIYEDRCSELIALDEELVMNDDGCISFKYGVALYIPEVLYPGVEVSSVVAYEHNHLMREKGDYLIERRNHRPSPVSKIEGDLIQAIPKKSVGAFHFGKPFSSDLGFNEAAEKELIKDWTLVKGTNVDLLLDKSNTIYAVSFQPDAPIISAGILLTGQDCQSVGRLLMAIDEELMVDEDMLWSQDLGVMLVAFGACYPGSGIDRVILYGEGEDMERAARHLASHICAKHCEEVEAFGR